MIACPDADRWPSDACELEESKAAAAEARMLAATERADVDDIAQIPKRIVPPVDPSLVVPSLFRPSITPLVYVRDAVDRLVAAYRNSIPF